MYKIIGADQKEYGPVSADQINAWILEGRANGQTLAQAVGSTEWRALSLFPEFATVLAAKRPAPPPLGSADPETTADAVLERGVQVNVSECLGRAWSLLRRNFGLFLGASLLLALIRLGLEFFVPILGGFAYFVMFGALYGGYCMIILKRVRGEHSGVGDLFTGFSQDFVQFMLAGVVISVLTTIGKICCVIPGIYLAVAWKFSLVLVADRHLEFWPAMESSRRVITRYWFQLFGILVVAYLPLVLFMGYSLFHMFTVLFPVVINGGGRFDFSEMIRLTKGFLPLWIIQQLIEFLTLPFATAAVVYAYEDLFGTRPAKAA